MSLVVCSMMSCQQKQENDNTSEQNTNVEIILKDYGAEPAVLDIEAFTDFNTGFRTALWTGSKLQVTLMSIPVGGEVGLKIHDNTDQFLRIESGKAKVLIGDRKNSLTLNKVA